MSANVFISSNNIFPYNIITYLNPDWKSLSIDSEQGASTKRVKDYLYLIVKDGYNYPELKVKVENESGLGIALDISKVDTVGNPIKWDKVLTFNDCYTNGVDYIQMFAYRWSAINNIYLTKSSTYRALLNIYEVT